MGDQRADAGQHRRGPPGSGAERVVLGEHTNGGQSDNDRAVTIDMSRVKCGFAGAGMFIGEDGLPHGYLTDEIKARADALMVKYQEALVVVATAVYEHRRLNDERLDAVLASAGFTLPRRTA